MQRRLRHRGQLHEARGVQPAPGVSAVRVAKHRLHLQLGAVDMFIEDASFDPPASGPGSTAANELRAPFNGKVIAVKAQAGASVRKGDTLVVLESMKLEHALTASRDGIVKSLQVEAGQQAATSQVLLTLEPA